MSLRVDTSLLTELKAYGHVNVEACFNCGNCSAICPLAEDASFPRRIIRYAQVGAKDALLGSRELWLCYYCGECSKTCPRQAEPGEFMAAARRYAIAHYDFTGIAKALFRNGPFNILLNLLLVIFFSAFLLAFSQGAGFTELALWQFLPEVVVQASGVGAFLIAALILVVGISRMSRAIVHADRLPIVRPVSTQRTANRWKAAWLTLWDQVLGHRNFRKDECEEDQTRPWPFRKWFIHASILFGFFGLFGATALDFLFKPLGSWVPIYYPPRLLGTVAGVLLIYGTSLALNHRLRRRDKYTLHSHPSDWLFLILIWLIGLSGFLLEIAAYAPSPASWAYPLLIFHVALVMDLAVMLPLSKFAHSVYRTTALYMHAYRHKEAVEHRPITAASA